LEKKILTDSDLADMLDQQLTSETGERWDGFYANRAKPCPFFVEHPDESLHQWINGGKVSGDRAFDLGCGNARNSIFLAQNGFQVDGIDFSQTALDWGLERAKESSVQINLVCNSIFDFAPIAGQYDLVYDSGCFHHIAPHRRKHYCEIVSRMMKPGGRFGLSCFRPEGGSGLTDLQVYEQRTMGGGLGYTEAQLQEIWSPWLTIEELRPMVKQSKEAQLFGEDFLWVMLAKKL
jgi:SAM-dependent methyltransferase